MGWFWFWWYLIFFCSVHAGICNILSLCCLYMPLVPFSPNQHSGSFLPWDKESVIVHLSFKFTLASSCSLMSAIPIMSNFMSKLSCCCVVVLAAHFCQRQIFNFLDMLVPQALVHHDKYALNYFKPPCREDNRTCSWQMHANWHEISF